MMQTKIRQLHRVLVDRVAASGWLRGQAGSDASWRHYERHARAQARADALHARARQRGERAAQHGPPQVAAGWQARIARLTGLGVDGERPGK
jgi:hypothetical protein